MRMSCNGCRVLRKACSDDCSIRPCLEWIKSPDSQAKATVFLAKFYGRAGLMNLINSGPSHLRPAIFRSLLYEACGRIVNPVYGSVGLLWTGSWQLCQNAVEAVLVGAPITQVSTDGSDTNNGPPLKAFDIRHVNKEDNLSGTNDLHRVRTRCRFKRSGAKSKKSPVCVGSDDSGHEKVNRSPSHESSLSHQSAAAQPIVERKSPEIESLGSAETMEADLDPDMDNERRTDEDSEVELELTLGFEPVKRCPKLKERVVREVSGSGDDEARFCEIELGLDYSAS